LIDIGFKNPVTLIEKQPPILGCASDSIQEKVDRLRSLGFSNPVELIQKMPQILGLASDSIQQKVRTMFRVYHVMDPSITQEVVLNMIENNPNVLSYSRSRWSLVARSLSYLKEKGIDITKYSQLTSLNSLYTASLPRYYQEGDSLKNIITRVKQVDKEILEEQLAYYEKNTSEDPYEKLTRLFKNTGKK